MGWLLGPDGPCIAVFGAGWNWLEPAGTHCIRHGAASASTQRPPCARRRPASTQAPAPDVGTPYKTVKITNKITYIY